jgi:cytochrome c-type biogenesis protein CcmF
MSAANLRRNFTLPVTAALVTLALLLVSGTASGRPFALIMFTLGAFVVATVAQELWRGAGARRAMTAEAMPRAFVQLIRRNRRRYGGYIVHAGVALLLVGVAASSSFQHSHDLLLSPGQQAAVDGYTFRYLRPTAQVSAQKLAFGAVLAVSKHGKHVTTLKTSRGFYPAQDVTLGEIGRFFNGQSDSQVGLRAGLTRDLWTVINPDLGPLQPLITRGNQVFAAATAQAMTRVANLPPSQAQSALAPLWAERDRAVTELAARFVSHPWPVNFLLIVSPLVTWIWLGAGIVALGGLIALWPLPAAARRPAAAPYAARLARELA